MPNVKLIIAQRHDEVERTIILCGKGGPDISATNSLGEPKFRLWTVRGDHVFCHRQSGGIAFLEGGGPNEV